MYNLETTHGFLEIKDMNSLLEIGNILFKDARDFTTEETAAMEDYIEREFEEF